MEEILHRYEKKKSEIKKSLEKFKIKTDYEQFKEFQFCLLTPQSNAQRCWTAVELISKIENPSLAQITEILSKKTRFHNTKAKRIARSREMFSKIKYLLSNPDKVQLRNQISQIVNGYGLKESSHFLRNIGLSENKIAILDRHIIKNLFKYNAIKEQKIKSKKNYLEIEKIFIEFASKINIPLDELDILWWSQENGEIFK